MSGREIKFCPECGATGLAIREVTPSQVVELYCAHCGVLAILLWLDHEVVGIAATHDPDSDNESW
jgi:hypothetical protein